MGREIERKYLTKNDGWRRKAGPGVKYCQGYLSTDPERSVRVRIAGDNAVLTVKGKSEGSARAEFEYPIPKPDAEEMLGTLCAGPLVEKTRYVVRDGTLKWEIDEFEGENRGLVIAEVETESETHDIAAPPWLGKEVTGDPRFYNLNLSQNPYSKWPAEEK